MGWMWETYEDISDAIGRALEPSHDVYIPTYTQPSMPTRWDMEEAFDTALMLNRASYYYPAPSTPKYPPRYVRNHGTPNACYIQFRSLGKGPKHGVKRIWRESTHWRLMRLGYKTWTDERGRKWVDYDTISKEVKVYDCDGKEVVNE